MIIRTRAVALTAAILWAGCSDEEFPLTTADAAVDAGLPDRGLEPDAGPEPDAGDGGLERGTYAYCRYASDTSCYSTEEGCEAGWHPPQFRTNGFCDCAPWEVAGYTVDCLGRLGGPCRGEAPRCEPGSRCNSSAGPGICEAE